MRSWTAPLGLLLLLTLAAPPLRAQENAATPLAPGVEVRGELPHEGRPYRTFSVQVPEGARRLTIRMGASADADVYVKAGSPIVDSWIREATAYGNSDAAVEVVVLSLDTEPRLEATTYYVDVVHGGLGGGQLPPIEFTLGATIDLLEGGPPPAPGPAPPAGPAARPATELPPPELLADLHRDGEVQVALPAAGPARRTVRVTVPPGAQRLELALTGASGDLDLYARHGAPVDPEARAEHAATTANPAERLVIAADGAPPLRPGPYYVDVVRVAELDRSATLVVRIVPGAPPATPAAPPSAAPSDPEAGVRARIERDTAMDVEIPAGRINFVTFAVVVPADPALTALELSVRGAAGNLDIYARHGAQMGDWAQADHRATGAAASETLLLRRDGQPPLRDGVYYVDVARAGEGARSFSFSVRYLRGAPEASPPDERTEEAGDEGVAGAPLPSSEADVAGEVHRDTVFALTFDPQGPRYRTYVVVVPKDAASLLVTAVGAEEDIDLYLRHGQPMADYQRDAEHRANSARHDEQLYVDASSKPALRPGKYYLDVVHAGAPAAVGPIEITVRFGAERPPPLPATEGPVQPVSFGQRIATAIERSERKAARFSFEVPAGARRLHVAVLGATRDVDLFLRRGAPVSEYGEGGYDHRAMSARLNEWLVIDGRSTPPLAPGLHYLDVVSLVDADAHIQFELVVTVDEPPLLGPDDFRMPPFVRARPPGPLERALEAVVEVNCENGGGSGTCLSPSGYILTNHHVLFAEGELQQGDIYVSFSDGFDDPPRQVFVAELVDASEELDLALIRIVRDIYDRRLPPRLELPWLQIGDSDSLRLGDPLYVAGYPGVGGDESRSSISVTRGIVSGFNKDPRGERLWIKTDTVINSGNSGGTALDARYRFVGIPTMKMVQESNILGYCRPTNRIPARWRELIRADQQPR